MIDLKAKPFFLNDDDIKWVEETIGSMTQEEKIGQLFCLIAYDSNEEKLGEILDKYNPGGLMYRPLKGKEVLKGVKYLQENSKIPMLISANLERGGNGIASDGTSFGSNMQVGATRDPEMAKKLGVVCGREGAAVGANWAFAPVVDIDYNFRNPITNTRTFGSDPEIVLKMGSEYVKAVQAQGVAASIKHFPGDGVDERDQHLVTSVNSLSVEDWNKTYGKIYKTLIDEGAMTVMTGHITQPAWIKKINPDIKDEDILPGSLSGELMQNLLRGELGFNGLVVSDATTMIGMMVPMPREKSVPLCIANGADMFLFTRNSDEDYEYMRKGVETGVITPQRLDEAITRILATKAALRLHEKKAKGTLVPDESALNVLGCEEHRNWARECADKSITLVKNNEGILPISPEKYPRVLLYILGDDAGYFDYATTGKTKMFLDNMKKEGFNVTIYEPSQTTEGAIEPTTDITDKYDLVIYLAVLATKSNQTVVRIEWAQPMGRNAPMFINAIPTIFISTENPYHLIDVPRIKTFINTYNSSDDVMDALVDKLMGRSEFLGYNPVDPFCGMWDTKL